MWNVQPVMDGALAVAGHVFGLATASPTATFVSILVIAAILAADNFTIGIIGDLTLVATLVVVGSTFYVLTVAGVQSFFLNFANAFISAVVIAYFVKRVLG